MKVLDHASTSASTFPACQAVGDGVQSSRDARHNSAEKPTEASRDGVDKALETPSNAGANIAEARKDGTHGCRLASEKALLRRESTARKSVGLLLDHIQTIEDEILLSGFVTQHASPSHVRRSFSYCRSKLATGDVSQSVSRCRRR